MFVTVKRDDRILFTTTTTESPAEYCQGCCRGESVYKSWQKLDLWTYKLIPDAKVEIAETLVFFTNNKPRT